MNDFLLLFWGDTMSRLDIIEADTDVQLMAHAGGLTDRIFISDLALHAVLSDTSAMPKSPWACAREAATSLATTIDNDAKESVSHTSTAEEESARVNSSVDLVQARRELTTLMRFVIEVSSGMRSVWAMPRERLSLRTINLVETLNRRNLLVQSRGPWSLRCHPVAYRNNVVEFSGMWGKAGRPRALAGRAEYCSENGYWRITSLRFL